MRPKLSILYSMYLIGIKYILYYIIFTHAFLHISVQLEGESILTVEMLVKTISKGTVLFAEMLVEDNFKGEAFQLLNVCVKNNLKGEAFKLLKGW